MDGDKKTRQEFGDEDKSDQERMDASSRDMARGRRFVNEEARATGLAVAAEEIVNVGVRGLISCESAVLPGEGSTIVLRGADVWLFRGDNAVMDLRWLEVLDPALTASRDMGVIRV